MFLYTQAVSNKMENKEKNTSLSRAQDITNLKQFARHRSVAKHPNICKRIIRSYKRTNIAKRSL